MPKWTIREDWQLAICQRDLGYAEAALQQLAEKPDRLPLISPEFSHCEAFSRSYVANRLYGDSSRVDRERQLLDAWPQQSRALISALKQEHATLQAEIARYLGPAVTA